MSSWHSYSILSILQGLKGPKWKVVFWGGSSYFSDNMFYQFEWQGWALKIWATTTTLLMWPWPMRMVSRWKHTRWSWQLQVHSSLLCLVYAPRLQEDSPLPPKVAFAAEPYSPLPPQKILYIVGEACTSYYNWRPRCDICYFSIALSPGSCGLK